MCSSAQDPKLVYRLWGPKHLQCTDPNLYAQCITSTASTLGCPKINQADTKDQVVHILPRCINKQNQKKS